MERKKILLIGDAADNKLTQLAAAVSAGPAVAAEAPAGHDGRKIVVMHNSTLHGNVKKDIFTPGRNEKCRCGSGKKYKKCCLEKDQSKTRDMVRAASEHNKKSR